MTDENTNTNTGIISERTLLYVFTGIGITLLIYLFFKDQFRGQSTLSLNSSQYPTLLENTNSQNSQYINTTLRTNELENEVQSLKEQLKITNDYLASNYQITNQLNNKLNSLNSNSPRTNELETEVQNLRNQLKIAQEHITSNTQLLAKPIQLPTVQKLNDSTENKIRQLKFRML